MQEQFDQLDRRLTETLNELDLTREKLNNKENELFAFKPIIDFGQMKIKEAEE